jgi:hypothetical protein
VADYVIITLEFSEGLIKSPVFATLDDKSTRLFLFDASSSGYLDNAVSTLSLQESVSFLSVLDEATFSILPVQKAVVDVLQNENVVSLEETATTVQLSS